MVTFHNKNKSDLTIATYLESNTKDSGLINFNKNNLISSFEEKKSKKFKKPKWCNAGIYILSSKIINILDKKDKDFAKDLFPRIIKLGFKFYAFKINKLLTFDTLKLYNKNKYKII
jgi:NDP-sugar pyrophosphorylase family protein